LVEVLEGKRRCWVHWGKGTPGAEERGERGAVLREA